MLQDLRFALRLIRRNPAFSLAIILTLALGIGANTAIFSVVDRVLLRQTPFTASGRLALVWETDRKTGTTREPASVPDFLDFQTRSQRFERLSAFLAFQMNLTPPDGEPQRLNVLSVSQGLLPMLGVTPVLGRTFSEEEVAVGGPAVTIISEKLWERIFQRDPTSLGRVVPFDEQPYTIVGVVPASTDFGILQILSRAAYSRGFADRGDQLAVDAWVPLRADPQRLPRSTHPILVMGRLSDSASALSAQEEMTAIAADLERAYPENEARGVFVETLEDVVFGPVRPSLVLLIVAVALVLLVGCVNVACLLLARSAPRMREAAIRSAVGAGRARLIRQFLVEAIVLALVSGLVGVTMAFVGLRVLVAQAPADVPRLADVTVDLRVLLVTLGISVFVGLMFGLLPALAGRGVDLQASLREGSGRSSSGRGRRALLAGLVVAEVALAVVLVTAAGLLMRSLWQLQRVDPGFETTTVLKAEYQLPASRYPASFATFPNFKEVHAFTHAVLSRARAIPGVESVAVAGNHPLDPGFTNSFSVVGREAEARDWPEISVRRVTPGYFQTVGLSRVHGRLLLDSDETASAPVLLINEAAAQRFFPNRDPIGAQIRLYGAARTIVGVVANERFQGLNEAAPIAAYLPFAQAPSSAGVLLVRTARDPNLFASATRNAIYEVDPALAVFGLERLVETVSRSMSQRRFIMLLLVIFAATALALAAIGIYGVLSYGVQNRTSEIAVRLALGAGPRRVMQLVVREGMTLALGGLLIGLLTALAGTRLLESLLFGVTSTDAWTFVSVVCLLGLTAAIAITIPAWRASRIQPVTALRADQ